MNYRELAARAEAEGFLDREVIILSEDGSISIALDIEQFEDCGFHHAAIKIGEQDEMPLYHKGQIIRAEQGEEFDNLVDQHLRIIREEQ